MESVLSLTLKLKAKMRKFYELKCIFMHYFFFLLPFLKHTHPRQGALWIVTNESAKAPDM